jgi:uncharacterized UPF0160 family protein
MPDPVTVAVYDGTFHADDVFSVALLKLLHPALRVIRTRDRDTLAQADFRVDVGGAHDPETRDFDHHQPGVGARENGIPYAAIGLLWQHYGLQVAGSAEVAATLDARLIQLIDARDNGYTLAFDEADPAPYELSTLIDRFNPPWHDEEADHQASFDRAVEVAGTILHNELREAQGEHVARDLVLEAIARADGSHVVVLERECPHEDILLSHSEALYVLYPARNGTWRIKGVPARRGSFDLRKPLPAPWAGKEGEEFKRVSGVAGARFCHKGRFMAVAESYEHARQLADIAARHPLD